MNRKIVASLLGVFVGLSLLVAGFTAVNTFTNWRIAPVDTNAMAPAISQGSLIVAKLTPEKDIQTGDVVSLGMGGEQQNVIGRVMEITSDNENYFNISIKGDNRALPDDFPYKIRDVTYKEQFSIPLAGFVVGFLASTPGFILITALTLIVGLFYIFRLHIPLTKAEKTTKQVARARRKAQLIIEERENYGGVEEMKAFFAESEV